MFAEVDKEIKNLKNLPVKYSELSPGERIIVRHEYIKRKNNKCLYCSSSLNKLPPKFIHDKKIHKELFPPMFFNYPVHLHHNHDTNMTIGAVHALCNAVLWEYENE